MSNFILRVMLSMKILFVVKYGKLRKVLELIHCVLYESFKFLTVIICEKDMMNHFLKIKYATPCIFYILATTVS